MEIGKNIRYYRKAQHLTQQQLADKASMSRTYLADIEKDRYNSSVEVVSKIAEALGIQTSKLLGEGMNCDSKTEDFREQSDRTSVGNPSADKNVKARNNMYSRNFDIVPEIFTDAEIARIYVRKHKIFASEGFDVSKLNDKEVLEFANLILDQMKIISYKYKR